MIFLYICEHYYEEYNNYIKKNSVEGIEIIPYGSTCVKTKNREIYMDRFDKTNSYIIGPRSCQALSNYPFEKNHFIEINGCYEHLLDPDFAAYLIGNGCYIISNQWLKNWKSNIENFGFKKRTECADFFRGFCSKLTLVTANDHWSEEDLGQMSDYLGIATEVVVISDAIIDKNMTKIKASSHSIKEVFSNESRIHIFTKAIAEISECKNSYNLNNKIMEYTKLLLNIKDVSIVGYSALEAKIQSLIKDETDAFWHEKCLYVVIRVYDRTDMVIKASRFGEVENQEELNDIAKHYAKALSSIITKYEIETNLRKNQSRIFYEDKMSSIGQMAGSIAHEINNPLSFIASNMSVLQSYLKAYKTIVDEFMLPNDYLTQEMSQEKKFMDEDIPLLMEEMNNGVDRIGKIVQRFRSITNIDSTSEIESLDPKKFIEDIWFLYGKNYESIANVELKLAEMPPVRINKGEIALCMYDVIANAKDAIEARKIIEKGYIEITLGVEGSYLRISVSDNGVGVNEEIRHRVFEPFFTTKEIGEGIGLGLSFAYDVICHGHNGHIELFTNKKGLTECKILLPLEPDYM